MKVGDRVRVKESVVVYHHPENRSQPYDLQGMTGEIIGFATEWQGKAISANFPILIKFDSSKFRAHLKDHELELI